MNSLSFKTAFGWITVTDFDKKIKSVEFAKKKNKGKSKNLVEIKKQISLITQNQYFHKTTNFMFKNITNFD